MERQHRTRRGVLLLAILSLTVSGTRGVAIQESFYDVLPVFEKRLSQAVVSWKNGNHSRARDGFYQARDLLSEHMPTPMDAYGWNWSRSLKTYAIVLARLVELESIKRKDAGQQMRRMRDQAMEWADVLQQQAMEWRVIKVSGGAEARTRQIWINRYVQAIRRVRFVCEDKESYPSSHKP